MPRLTAAHALALALGAAPFRTDASASPAGVLARPLATPVATPVATPIVHLAQPQVPPVGWRTLASLDLRTGTPGEELRRVAGTTVMVPGYIVPFEDFSERAKEFLLVPYMGACVHEPPPPPNQMVYVTMTSGKPVEFSMWRPVWIEGTLEIDTKRSVYGAASFSMKATRVIPYER